MAEKGKPVVVRVKRKAFHEPLDGFWLEINERPHKRSLLDIGSLSISDSTVKEDAESKKVLVQHVETISSSDITKDVLESFLTDSADSEELRRNIEERRNILKQRNQKQHQLRSTAIRKHEDLARSARFEQIWKSRKSGQEHDETLHEMCHIYDVERVDSEGETSNELQGSKNTSTADDAILCNYLPLLREYLPTAATEIESSIASKQGNYVYDIYTVDDDMNLTEENTLNEYPLVQVDVADDFYDGASESEYDSEDSNAENSDLHDYPDEESSEDEERSEDGEHENGDEFEDLEGSVYSDGVEIADIDEDEKNDLIWRYR